VCFLSTGKGGKSSSELVSLSEEPLKRKSDASVVVEQKLESSEVISETPSKKRSRTKQKSIKATTLEENSVSNVKINKTSVQKETLVGTQHIFFTCLYLNFLFVGKLFFPLGQLLITLLQSKGLFLRQD